ncbi:hypothetical protein DL766_006582 [Monosporascus sp. MC13-8B]|uniref:Extracellular membrane protein CFEM domain-containing protein n=1 Tax=Monosporascus cannonballus TaxID=155416 RepID=A0ABY0GQK3_9PEZI|nr:hypothetical protein DL762_010550 [Monosporascus cannonballus]RYO79796.1 hypothetical protein DL763_009141 [Monosporascus cannonballus]RYP26871.1 hypothetical protein DL766_006582 [Monosporascus sp. MC13-8B]
MRSFPPALLFFTAPLVRISAAVDNDFSAYPTGSRPCLEEAAAISECTGDTGPELNNCLCSNGGGFIDAAARCVARESSHDLTAVYRQMRTNCAGTGNAIALTEDEFIALGDSSASNTESSSSSAPERTATPSQTQSQSDGPAASPGPTNVPETEAETDALSTGAKIGIGVGVGFGAIGAALAAWFIWVYARHRRPLASGVGDPAKLAPFLPHDPAVAEYAQYNKQHGVAELSSTEWKPGHGGGGGSGVTATTGGGPPAELQGDGFSGVSTLLSSSAGGGGGDGMSPLTHSRASGGFSSPYTTNTYSVSQDWSDLG